MTWAYDPEDRNERRSIAVIHRALGLGVTLLDTADMYGPYTNEELLGRALVDRRDQADIAASIGATAAQVSLVWLLSRYKQLVPIPGTRRPERLEENRVAADIDLPDAALDQLDRLPTAVGERY